MMLMMSWLVGVGSVLCLNVLGAVVVFRLRKPVLAGFSFARIFRAVVGGRWFRWGRKEWLMCFGGEVQ
jgi:hypothetical protein